MHGDKSRLVFSQINICHLPYPLNGLLGHPVFLWIKFSNFVSHQILKANSALVSLHSGIDVICDVPCRVLEGQHWKLILESLSGSIIFIDEENAFINTEEFAAAIQGTDNYFVLVTRENLYNLPYSVEEIYGLHSSGKYQNTKKTYQQMYRIYSNSADLPIKPKQIIVEDSNSGYELGKCKTVFAGIF